MKEEPSAGEREGAPLARKKQREGGPRARKEPSSDWIYGAHSVRNAVDAAPSRVRRVWVAAGRRSEALAALIADARALGIRVEPVDRRMLDRVAQGPHQGVAAQCHAVAPATEAELERRWPSFEAPFILVLDQVQDPRNLGACLRSAEAAGVDAVLIPKRHAAGLTAAAIRTSSGAYLHLFVVSVTNLARRLAWMKARGVWVVGGQQDAETSLHDIELPTPTAVVVGGEGKGLRRLTREQCDHLVRIPMAGAVSTLNVAVAAGILLFEVVRARQ